MPREMVWGVDSAYRQQRPNFEREYEGEQRYNFDIVQELTGMTPRFWGRYISAAEDIRLDEDEVTFLHDRECKILPIVTGLRQSLRRGTYREGQGKARLAIRRAEDFDIPHHVRIYADLEDYHFVTAEWILGWWTVMSESPYRGAGGLYGRPNLTMSTPEFSESHTGIVFPPPRSQWARNQFEPNGPSHQVVANNRTWGPAASTAANMRRNGTVSFNEREFDLLVECGSAISLSRYHWSNEPRTVSEDPPGTGPENVLPRRFAASDPVDGGVRTKIWQYRLNCYRQFGGGRTGLIDMNVALPEAFREMW